MTQKKTQVRLVYPSSRGTDPDLQTRLSLFKSLGLPVVYDEKPFDARWPMTAASLSDRLSQFIQAIEDPQSPIVWCARGGYGASDLLAELPWQRWKSLSPKWLVGFSDACALHSAFFSQLGWRTLIHGPMPHTSLWPKPGDDLTDVMNTIDVVTKPSKTVNFKVSYAVGLAAGAEVKGWLFGGCLSVLTNLLGTAYFPKHLKGALLFLEDIGENPGRLLRQLNQWHHLGILQQVNGIVLGQFRDMGSSQPYTESQLAEALYDRFRKPVAYTSGFGHCYPNFPLQLGADGIMSEHTFSWQTSSTRTLHT